jgi:hypothetical protein
MRIDAMGRHNSTRAAVAVSFWFFLGIVVLAPLPYGAAHVWSYSLLSILTGVALLLWAVAAALRA